MSIIETIKSEITYQGRVFDVRRDHVRLPDGQITSLDIVSHGEAVSIVPIDENGDIWFIRQYRHAVQKVLVELPAGALEPGEDLQACALRELREEIGMSAETFQKIGAFYLAPGYSTECLHVFLARNLSPAPLPGDADELLSVDKLPAEQVYSMAEQGVIRDAKSVAALFLARPYL